MKHYNALVLLLFSSILSACCPTTSIRSLSSPEKAQYEKQLEGTWLVLSENGEPEGYLHVGKTTTNLTKFIAVEIKSTGELDHTIFTGFPTKIAQRSYLNINAKELFEELPPERNGYIFAMYEVSEKNNLVIHYMQDDLFAQAIESGKLKGKITYKQHDTTNNTPQEGRNESEKKIECLQITDTSENILKFIENSEPNKLFSPELKLIKQKQ